MKKIFNHSFCANNKHTHKIFTILIILLMTITLPAQDVNYRFYDCNSTPALFQGQLPLTLCEQNPEFTPDITIPAGVTFASTLNIPNTIYGPAWHSRKILILGTLVVDVNVGFISCKVKMGAGAEIYTQGDVDVFSLFSSFFACDYMWKGITIYNDGAAKIYYSQFEDAETAFTLDDGTYAGFISNTFNRNDVGIRNANAITGQTGLVFDSFTKNTFTCTSPLNAPYSGQQINPGQVSFAGIYLDRCVTSIGKFWGSNFFSLMQHGIYAINSTVLVQNCRFENMVEEIDGGQTGGIGIAAFNGSLTVKESFIFNNQITGQSYFSNCAYAGISTGGTNLVVSNAVFSGNNFVGIDSYDNFYGETVKITDNTINMDGDGEFNVIGIAVVRSIASGSTPHNVISRNSIDIGGTGHAKFGIYIWGDTPAIDAMEITDNVVDVTNTDGQMFPIYIYLSPADQFKVLRDTITFFPVTESELFERDGITAKVCNGIKNEISFNSVNISDAIGNYNTAETGIYLLNAQNFTLCLNDVDQTQRGFFFEGDNAPAYFKSNNIGAHERGLFINHQFDLFGNLVTKGAIDPQIRHGNLWSANQSDYSLYAAHCASDPDDSPFIVENDDPTILPLKRNPFTDWFMVISGTLNHCSGLEAVPDAKLTVLDDQTISGNPTSAQAWEWEKRLLFKLLRFPTLAATGTNAATFFNNQIQSAPGKLANVDFMVWQALVTDSVTQASLDDIQSERLAWLDSLLSLENAYGDPLDTFSINASLISAKMAIFESISLLDEQMLTIEDQIRAGRISLLDSAANFNQSIVTTQTFEENQKQLNTLLIKRAKGVMLDSTDFALAQNIATLVRGTEDFTEKLANMLQPFCQSGGIGLRSVNGYKAENKLHEEMPGMSVVPNPAGDQLDVYFDRPVSGTLVILNISGQVLLTREIRDEMSPVHVNVSSLPPSVYFLRLKAAGTVTSPARKFIIQR